MFRIGEFAQIAQVSGRQLRYYEQLGLLQPGYVDPETGYRHYHIRQLPRLNRILALKELGLTLDQIGPLLDNQVSPAELRGMLAMRRTQIEQSLRAEETRLRHIQSRIDQLDRGENGGCDVVLKSVPAMPYLSLRTECSDMEDAVRCIGEVARAGLARIRPGLRDKLVVASRNDGAAEALDLDIGFTLTRASNLSVRIADDRILTMGELPAVGTMATVVRSGPDYASHRAFGALGEWMEAQGYRIAGACREVFLEPIGQVPDADALVEIQFPVQPVD